MIKDAIIENTAFHSPIGAASCIKPEAGFWKKRLVATVILTSLVDAFSILVIYLLVSFSPKKAILIGLDILMIISSLYGGECHLKLKHPFYPIIIKKSVP